MLYFSDESNVGDFEFHRIDSAKYFGAAVDAGLIKFRVGADIKQNKSCPIFASVGGEIQSTVGLVNNQFVYDVSAYNKTSSLERSTPPFYTWRQGIKHDLVNVLELREINGKLVNRLGETAIIESEVIYNFYKSSDIFHGREPRYVVPVYQQSLKDNLEQLPLKFPKLYSYLMKYEANFKNRKSSIYKNKNSFTLFGIGDYTHSKYKVAIGGLYSQPIFRLLKSEDRLITVDDTSYAISTDDYEEAKYLHTILNLDCTRDFLMAISCSGDKRRFSKEILSRLSIPACNKVPEDIKVNLDNTVVLEEWLLNYKSSEMLF